MNNANATTDVSFLEVWWKSIDKTIFFATIGLLLFGIYATFSSSSAVAIRIGYNESYFYKRHIVFASLGFLSIAIISMLPAKIIRRGAIIALGLGLILLILMPFIGTATHGATRWISLGFVSFQPSEIVKPAFIVFTAWMFNTQFEGKNIPGVWISTCVLVFIITMFLLQPDFGQSVLIILVWISQFVVIGLPVLALIILAILCIFGIIVTYFSFEHVQVRIDKWLFPKIGDTFQIQKSIDGISNSGFFGKGLFQGDVKNKLPDAHTDFIFSVIAEEGGLFLSTVFLALLCCIIYKALISSRNKTDLFILLTLVGLTIQIALQSCINLASAMALIPSKGMTLPLVSYGGTSLLALSINFGVILAFTRKNYIQ